MAISRRAARFVLLIALGLFALMLAIGLRRGAEASRDQLEQDGLPRDLAQYVGQFVELHLPANLTDLRWLGRGLQDLEISSLELGVPVSFPPNLRSFHASGPLPPDHLERIPSHVKSLRLPGLVLKDWPALPTKMVELEVVGGGSLRQLPRSLQRLSLTGHQVGDPSRLGDLWGLPPVSDLELRGDEILTLEGIPASVRSLAVRLSKVRSVARLPEGLEQLDLEGNQDLAVIDVSQLPRHLIALRIQISAQPLPATTALLEPLGEPGWPRYLRHLSLRRLDSPLARPWKLPSGLISLEADYDSLTDLLSLPSRLESLHYHGGSEIDLGSLPENLRTLILQGSDRPRLETLTAKIETLQLLNVVGIDRLEHLPPTLRHLIVSGTGSPLVCNLPAGLETLTLQQASRTGLPPLPAGLTRLDLTGWRDLTSLAGVDKLSHLEVLRIGSTGVTEITRLPASLRELHLSNTEIASTAGLPRSLKVLDISGFAITGLRAMPPELEQLTFGQYQLKTLAGMPGSVVRLSIKNQRRPRTTKTGDR